MMICCVAELPDVWRPLNIHSLVHMLVNLPHSVQELGLQHLLKGGQLGGGHLPTVLTLLQFLQELAGAPDVPRESQVAVHLRYVPVHVHLPV